MIILILVLFLLSLYLYSTKNHDYWAKRNIKHEKPVPLFGTNFKNQFGLKSITEVSIELYNKYSDEQFIGYYRGTTPELIIRDVDIARAVLTSDFSHFYPRGLGRNPEVERILTNLFHADGDAWKLLRQRLTAAFTTAKLKNMFPLVVNCAEKLQRSAAKHADTGTYCDVRELMACFTIEFIGACGFGIEMDTINDEQSQFRKLGKLIKTVDLKIIIKFTLWQLFPALRKIIFVGNPKVEQAVKDIYLAVREKRNNKPSGRNDFIDLLLELETKGKIIGESIETCNADGTPKVVEKEMDLSCMIGQVFVFFAAGFDTSATATSFTLHNLANHPEIQRKIQQQIDEIMRKYNNKLCYDAIAEMDLLSNALKESMRIFPSLGVLNRVCAKKYTFPGTDLTIDPGVRIVIPIQAMQNDEKYFNDPKDFRPERFSKDSDESGNKAYMPFGEGPRKCIGARLGEMQSLAGLAAILHKFTLETDAYCKKEIEVEHAINVVQSISGELPVILKLRDHDDV